MKKYSLLQKVMALALTAVLVIGMVPNISLPVTAAEQASLTVTGKVADSETLNNWQDYYGDNSLLPDGTRGISTWKAGGVWTDKSVFTDASAFPSSVTLDDPNAFLVSLSALASNKEVVGQSSTPIDTMLVLDLSNSMDQSQSVEDMIDAANDAIHALLEMNVNNRVGVVLYSGNSNLGDSQKSTATVILPLDCYTTTTTTTETVDGEQVTKYHYLTQEGEWIEVRNGRDTVEEWDTTVSVAAGTRNSQNQRVTGSKHTIGGTYIQNGLYQAYEEFAGMTDKGVVQSGTQAGMQRQPVVILMSDGAPTVATTEYNNVGESDTGNGGSTTDQITFLTQLTAAWVKGAVSDHYNDTETLFYTLGLGTANNENATAVLYPSGTTNDNLTAWWDNFLTGTERTDGTVEVQEEVEASGRPDRPGYQPGQDAWYLDYDNDGFATGTGKNYVDRYWAASDADGMVNAFIEIVEEIGLQSAYSATLVESGDADLDGYITVEDELGAMMQVKDVKGILLGTTLYSGAELAKSMNENTLGTTQAPTEYGDEFVRTIKERLGITDTSVAQLLINSAYLDGQISYTSDSVYSNYIGWYGDADNAYLGFWDKDTGMTATGAPSNAKYINQSYGFLGGTVGSAGATDMMHIIVMVHTEIATGHQTVLFKIPSALIPMITYKVELEGDSLETATELSLTVEETDPIRLLYEVGLPDDVNNINIDQKVEEYLAKGGNHIHTDEDGNYVFYANSWDDDHDNVAPVIENLSNEEKQALTGYVAESHFIPNTANERFYVLEDSTVYTRSGNTYTPVTSGIDPNGTYYFARTIVTVTGANGAAEAVTQYEVLYPATIANADNFQKNDTTGYWEVKAGTIRQHLTELALEKEPENYTGTLPDSDNLWVYVPGSSASDYNIYSFLGNNGKLTVKPATGLKVTKEVAELADGAAADEEFEIHVLLGWDATADNMSALAVTDADGNLLDSSKYAVTASMGQVKVVLYLADGESAYVTGMPAGVEYEVTEAANDNYAYTYEGAAETVIGEIVEGVVTNTPIQPGNLYITKEVVHAHAGETFPTDYEFEFKVTFVDADGNPIANTTFQLENNYDTSITELTTNGDGVMEGKLRHGETVYIKGIPAGAKVTVEEVNLPADGNYTLTGYRSRNHSGDTADNNGVVTIVSEQNATVVVTNTYTPKSTTVDLDIDGTKDFNAEGNEALLPGGSFTFKVQQWNGTGWDDIPGMTATVEYAAQEDGVRTFKIEDVLSGIEYEHAGTYTYQVIEVKGSVANVTYDRTLYTFTVTVVDVDGQLVATVTDLNNQQITDGSYEVIFENTFHTAPVSIDIVKDVENKSGNPDISKAGFQFVAVQTDENWVPLTGEDAATLTVYSDGAGEARLTATYKAAGSYYYIVTETNQGADGWDYSDAQYKITVVVTEDETTGDLSAAMTIVPVEGTTAEGETASVDGNSGKIIFKNTYDPKDAEVELNVVPTVVKKLEGRGLKAGEFTFAIFENGEAEFDADGNLSNIGDAVATGTNDAEGNVTFTPEKLTFETVGKYEYDVVEVKGSLGGVTYDPTIYDLVIEVTDNGDGTLKAVYYFEDAVDNQVAFENTYTAQPAEAVIEGLKTIKVISGLKTLAPGDYTFGLYATDDQGNPVGEPLLTTKNLANGSFKFDAIEYTLADAGKTFTYVVMEIAPDGTTDGSYSAGGVDYSGQSFSVSVAVKDNGDGTLSAEVVGNGASIIEFVNEYSSIPVSVSLPGTKTLNGRDLTEGEFKFALYKSNADFTEHTLITDEITHDGEGKINFSFGTLGLGYHYYVVKEVIPETRAPGIHYDASEYHITIQVVDSGNGKMSALTTVYHPGNPSAENPPISFINQYAPEDGEIDLGGTKIYNGGKTLEDDVFEVGLYETDDQGKPVGDPLQTAKIKADGTFAFQPLPYTAEDVDKTYTYAVMELIPEDAVKNEDGTYTSGSHIYDGVIYTVEVSVADTNKDGVLEITKTINGTVDGPISFTNTFVPDPIDYVLKAKKTYEKGLKGNDFKFTLVSADDKTDVDQTKLNDADGNVTFDKITFPEAGTYTFHVEEIDKVLGFIEYSTAKYLVTIEVVNENGVLRVVEPISVVNLTDNSSGDLTFVNTYKLDGEGEVTLRGSKVLTGDRTTVNEGEFEFGLYDEAGKLVESVKNDANGNFQFSTLKFDESHTDVNGEKQYTYTVKEIPGSDPNVTYDTTTVYTVVITVKDNDQGGVDVSYTVNGVPSGQIAIVFTNTFTKPADVLANIYIQKQVINKSEPGIGLDGFEFILEQVGGSTHSVISNAQGRTGFQITLGWEHVGQTYTFKVYEKKGTTAGITYDTTVYTVTVTVGMNPDGTLKTVINGVDTNGIELAFTNIYEKSVTPATGDNFPVILLGSLVLISGAAVVVLMLTKKKKPGKYAR